MNLFKILACSIFLVTFQSQLLAQPQIVEWSYEIVEDEGSHLLRITGQVKEGWYIYSKDTGEDGPIPTSIDIAASDLYTADGEVEEKSSPIKEYSDYFEIDIVKFKDEAVFEQRLTHYVEGTVVSGTIRYMCCDDKRCLPPNTIQFEVKS